jgi:hypothetical protein
MTYILSGGLRDRPNLHDLTENTPNGVGLHLYSGEDVVYRFTVNDTDGDPVNISTYTTITFQAHPAAGGAAVITKTGVLVSGGTGGQFDITIDRADTTALAGQHDTELQVSGTGFKKTLGRGPLAIQDTKS